MKTTNQKGRFHEQLSEKLLKEKYGEFVFTVPRVKFFSVDLFGLWDHLVQTSGGESIFVQTKSGKDNNIRGKDVERMTSFPAKHKFLFHWKPKENRLLLIITKY